MSGDDYIMMSAAAAVSIILNRRIRRRLQHNRQCWSRLTRVVTTPEHGKRDGKFRRWTEPNEKITSFDASWLYYVDSIGWLGDLICIVGPTVGPDSWMNVLTMKLLVQPVGWIWQIWFVQPVGPTGWTTVHATQLLIQLLDQPVGPTGWSNSWIV